MVQAGRAKQKECTRTYNATLYNAIEQCNNVVTSTHNSPNKQATVKLNFRTDIIGVPIQIKLENVVITYDFE